MKTTDFIRKHEACREGAEWALSISEDMADVWDALIKQEKWEWLVWTATQPSVFPDSTLRQLACRFVRETPLCDGRMVFDLLTDERGRNAIEAAERYADGKATEDDLEPAYAAARAAWAAAWAADAADAALADARAARAAADAAYAAAYTACAAARDAAAEAACAAACAAHTAAYAAYASAHAERAANAAADVAAAWAARAAAESAQIKMIAELGNPFKKGEANETADFLLGHRDCREGAEWALSISEDMAYVWDAMIEQKKHEWLLWTVTRPGVLLDSTLRRLACRFVRETPLHDGRKVWDLLTDERSRMAVEVSERYADGKATTDELVAAADAADAADAAAAAHSERAAYFADLAADAASDARAAADATCAAADTAAWAADAADAALADARAARAASWASGAAVWAAVHAADRAADAARAALDAAYSAAAGAAHAALDAEYSAAARAAAESAQIKMIAELGNPFKER